MQQRRLLLNAVKKVLGKEAKELTVTKPGTKALTSQRQTMVDLYSVLFDKLGMQSVIPMAKKLIAQMPDFQIEMEWKFFEDGTFLKVLETFLNYDMSDEDIQRFIGLQEGILVPYIQHQKEISPEDLKWAYREILKFVEDVRQKRTPIESPKLSAKEVNLLKKLETISA